MPVLHEVVQAAHLLEFWLGRQVDPDWRRLIGALSAANARVHSWR